MVEKFEAPIAAYGDLTYDELQALIERGRQERSKAIVTHAKSLAAVIGGLFRNGRTTDAQEPLAGSAAKV
ncbi:RSP_7527 family protein [Algihabitans albus]|uniref:RSP_7527 family protein n=1 Tax=Algihabitans albus TaxID=2164067 RepID=UPI000E5CF36D|nr:hypothetical protein [Algihabitans albus]